MGEDVERCGDLWIGKRDGRWFVGFSEEDVTTGPYSLSDWFTRLEARAYACGYMEGATP